MELELVTLSDGGKTHSQPTLKLWDYWKTEHPFQNFSDANVSDFYNHFNKVNQANQPEQIANVTQSMVEKGKTAAESAQHGKEYTIEVKEGKTRDDYVFTHFNQDGAYALQRGLNALAKNRLTGREASYKNTKDGTSVNIYKDRITVDNTAKNITAALDIAQDKGWDSINIKGGTKATKAEIWFQANMRGLATKGYEPTEQDMKRLLGAKENEKKESLDIKPKPQDKSQNPAQQNQTSDKQQEVAEKQPIKKQERYSTLEERIAVARNEIMNEYRAFAPDDKENYNDVENALNKVLTAAAQQGEGKFKEFAGKIKKGIPIVRNELANATQEESRKAKTEVAMQSKAAEKTQAMAGRPEKREKQLEK